MRIVLMCLISAGMAIGTSLGIAEMRFEKMERRLWTLEVHDETKDRDLEALDGRIDQLDKTIDALDERSFHRELELEDEIAVLRRHITALEKR